MNTETIKNKAHQLMDQLIEKRGTMQADWMVEEMMKALGGIEGKNAGFFKECARDKCYQIAKRVAATYMATEHCDDAAQLKLFGFDEIRTVYTVARGGKSEFVHVKDMTPEEKIDRGREMFKRTEAERKHALQLVTMGELELEQLRVRKEAA